MIENEERSSARTGGPAIRFPSVSYWPPWHGQPKPVTSTGSARCRSGPDRLLPFLEEQPVRLHRAAEMHATGEEHREGRDPFGVRPLLRMYIVRRVTSPISGSSRKVAITNSPSGKSSIGPSTISSSP